MFSSKLATNVTNLTTHVILIEKRIILFHFLSNVRIIIDILFIIEINVMIWPLFDLYLPVFGNHKELVG